VEPVLPIRRRRVRGYCIDSDDEPLSYSEDEEDPKPVLVDSLFDDEDELGRPSSPIKTPSSGWWSASLLPQYTERIEVPPDPGLNFAERFISSFTMYNELERACCDEDFERISSRLQIEWSYSTGLVSLSVYFS
jgi:hypothetical protein